MLNHQDHSCYSKNTTGVLLDLLCEDADLWVEGQSLGVIGVDDRRVRLKDDALARRLQSSSTHGHKQVHNLEEYASVISLTPSI